MNILELIEKFHLFRILAFFAVGAKLKTILPYLKEYEDNKTNKRIAFFLYTVPSIILLCLCLITNHYFFMILLLIEKGITSFIAARILKKGEIKTVDN